MTAQVCAKGKSVLSEVVRYSWKMTQDGAKVAPRRPKIFQEVAKLRPRDVQEVRSAVQEPHLEKKTIMCNQRFFQDSAQESPRWRQGGPSGAKVAPSGANTVTSWCQDGPKTPQGVPRIARVAPKRRPRRAQEDPSVVQEPYVETEKLSYAVSFLFKVAL